MARTVRECLSVYSGRILVTDYNRAISQMDGGIPTDVNGRPVAVDGEIQFSMLDEKGKVRDGVFLKYNPAGTVSAVTIVLDKSPMIARTPEEYRATGLYAVMVDALGASCDIVADPLQTYRFFENSVKPAFAQSKPESIKDERSTPVSHVASLSSRRIAVCGRHMTAVEVSGEDWDNRKPYNRFGSHASLSLKFD